MTPAHRSPRATPCCVPGHVPGAAGPAAVAGGGTPASRSARPTEGDAGAGPALRAHPLATSCATAGTHCACPCGAGAGGTRRACGAWGAGRAARGQGAPHAAASGGPHWAGPAPTVNRKGLQPPPGETEGAPGSWQRVGGPGVPRRPVSGRCPRHTRRPAHGAASARGCSDFRARGSDVPWPHLQITFWGSLRSAPASLVAMSSDRYLTPAPKDTRTKPCSSASSTQLCRSCQPASGS